MAEIWMSLQARQGVDHDGEKYRGNYGQQQHCEATDTAAERSYLHIAPNSHCIAASTGERIVDVEIVVPELVP